jgi:hypothetical protein
MTRVQAIEEVAEERRAEARKMLRSRGATGVVLVTCGKCGRTADVDAWTTRPVFGRLPTGEFQCPGCGFAFKRVSEPWEQVTDRYWRPGKVKLVPIETRM